MTKLLALPIKSIAWIAGTLAAGFTFLAFISWLAAGDAIRTVAPIFVYIVFASASLGILAALTLGGVFCFGWLRKRYAEYRRDSELAGVEWKRARAYLSAEEKMISATINQIRTGLIHPSELANNTFRAFPATVAKAGLDALPEVEQPRPALLETITRLDCVLYVGTRGRAKTTNMLRLMEARANREEIIVIDTHAFPNKWPCANRVLGSDPNMTPDERYSFIWGEMMKITTEIQSRLNQYRGGEVAEGRFPAKTVYIDEFTDLPDGLLAYGWDIKKFTTPMLNEGRKIGINMVWCSHGDTAADLGSGGRTKSVKQSFDAIVYLQKTPVDRYALVDFGDGLDKETKYALAPPYPAGQVFPADAHQPSSGTNWEPVGEPVHPMPALPVFMLPEIAMTDLEKDVCRLYQQGVSISKIAHTAFGNRGGKQSAKVKGILHKYGLYP